MPTQIGDYKVTRELGRGATGAVYLAVQESLDREVALKVMSSELAEEPGFVERFRREGAIAGRLRHPHIVQVYDFSCRDGLYFIAMEYLGARTLKDRIEAGRVPPDEAGRMLDQLLAALESAHALGIVHRDVKPANVILTDAGEVALTDFSIAHIKSATRLTATGAAFGTPDYMAPEQFDGHADARSDLYAAGIILYEMLTGLNPFRADSLGEVLKRHMVLEPRPLIEVDPAIPRLLSDIAARALAKDPDARYSSATDMRRALTGSPSAPSPGPVTRRSNRAILVVVLLVCGTAWVARGVWSQAHSDDTPMVAVTPEAPPPVLETSPMPTVPVPTRTPSATPSPVSALSPSPTPPQPPPVTFPASLKLTPGQGIGEVALGDTMGQVVRAWGKARGASSSPYPTRWFGNYRAVVVGFQRSDRVTDFAINSPEVSLAKAPRVHVGTTREVVRAELSPPDPRSHDSMWRYDRLGLSLAFPDGGDVCRTIFVRSKS